MVHRNRERNAAVSEYIFRLKKGDLELELRSDDARFIEVQMENWRNKLLDNQTKEPSANSPLQ
jgi:hypothetical protein